MICVPTSLAQEVGEGLSAQAGEAKLTEVLKEAAASAMFDAPRKGPSTWCSKPGRKNGCERLFVQRAPARPDHRFDGHHNVPD